MPGCLHIRTLRPFPPLRCNHSQEQSTKAQRRQSIILDSLGRRAERLVTAASKSRHSSGTLQESGPGEYVPRAPFPNDLESQNVALFLVFPFLLFEKIVKETEAVAKGIWAVRHMTNSARFRLRDSARLRLTMGPRCVGACATVLTGRPGKDWPSLETLVHGTGGALQQGKGWGLGSPRQRAGGSMGGGAMIVSGLGGSDLPIFSLTRSKA